MTHIGDRLKAVRLTLGESQKGMARRYSLGENGWQILERDARAPKAEVLAALAAEGIDLNWLVTGNGQMKQGETTEAREGIKSAATDEALMGRLIDGITAVYKDAGQAIAPINLGQLAARLHNEIISVAETPEEIPVAVKLRLAQLRKELLQAEANPIDTKRSA
jgi:transcriptional regulator with XRE-family HTH domain